MLIGAVEPWASAMKTSLDHVSSITTCRRYMIIMLAYASPPLRGCPDVTHGLQAYTTVTWDWAKDQIVMAPVRYRRWWLHLVEVRVWLLRVAVGVGWHDRR